MDYFAHGFWSYIVFHWTKRPWLAVLFGLLPDTLSWAVYFFYRLIFQEGFGKPMLEKIPDWVYMLYNISHSLIVCTVVLTVVFLIYKKWIYEMLAWPLAIIVDVFTHTRDFLPTPFLWPLSTYVFDGISWGTRGFMITNYVLIVSGLTIIIIKRLKNRPNPAKIYKRKKV
ncbi:hypothetical protein COV20_00455 [Candidatus Woesearchaeota archaeon CG10_big_fil_rev_8_21_14_0_10_45_16]|nr:MAG: hypothetical protein COV20_00455 [Candidatus Woesearchaeota archaeon CG10_big_fil_rev_8_21_14_0_10_45_16]